MKQPLLLTGLACLSHVQERAWEEHLHGLPQAGAKTTVAPERAIAGTGYEWGHIPDSSTYKWSADRCA